MSSRISIDFRFSSPICIARLDGFSRHEQGLREYVEQLTSASDGMTASNFAGWHSEPWLHVRPGHPDMQWLVESVRTTARESLKKLTGKHQGEPQLLNFWVNVNERGAWNMPHDHAGARWSGVVYVTGDASPAKAAEEGVGDGETLFINPVPLASQFGQPRTINHRAEPGMMLMFPGYLVHMVTPFGGSGRRITFSFNIDLMDSKSRKTTVQEQPSIPTDKMQSRVKFAP